MKEQVLILRKAPDRYSADSRNYHAHTRKLSSDTRAPRLMRKHTTHYDAETEDDEGHVHQGVSR
jgi:hypothetical protein